MRTRLLAVTLAAILAGGCLGRPAPDATGEEIYLQLCTNCHGELMEGVVGPPLGPGSVSASEPDEFLRFAIHQGFGRMPSFASSLDDRELGRLIDYIREVQGR